MHPWRVGLWISFLVTELTTARTLAANRTIEFHDPTYGAVIRHYFKPDGDEHDLYHYRSVFNSDNSRRLGIVTPKGSSD